MIVDGSCVECPCEPKLLIRLRDSGAIRGRLRFYSLSAWSQQCKRNVIPLGFNIAKPKLRNVSQNVLKNKEPIVFCLNQTQYALLSKTQRTLFIRNPSQFMKSDEETYLFIQFQ